MPSVQNKVNEMETHKATHFRRRHKLGLQPEQYDEYIRNRWLNLGDTSKLQTSNPFHHRSQHEIENPHYHILSLMRRPEYFSFTAKHIFGKQLPPFQLAILRELWYRPFPMLIGSRGMGKSFILAMYAMLRALLQQGSRIVIVGAAFRQAKVVFDYCQEIWDNAPVLRDLVNAESDRRQGPKRDVDRCSMRLGDSIIVALPLGDGTKIRGQRANIILADEFACLKKGTLVETDRGLMRIDETEGKTAGLRLMNRNGEYERPAAFIKTPPTTAYCVTTAGGYSMTCSGIHKVMTTKGWKLGKDLTADDYLVFDSHYKFPERQVEEVDESLGWLMGILTAEGSIADRYMMTVQMTDSDCVARAQEALQRLMPDREVKTYNRPAYIDPRGWDCKERFTAYCCNLEVRNRLSELGLDRVTAHDKKIPWSILQSPKSVVLAYLSGLFEGDGSAFLWTDRGEPNHLGVAYYSVSEQLCVEVQVILHKLGIFCTKQSRESKLSDKPQWMLRLNGEHAHHLARLLNVPKWRDVIAQARPPYDSTKSGVVWDKSRQKWKAEVYVEGRMKYLVRFATEEEAVACVAANRPSPSLRVKSVERLDGEQVLYDYYLPETNSFYGNGFVQHNSIPVDIFETVVSGFAAVSMSPIEKLQQEARMLAMEELGLTMPGDHGQKAGGLISNQTVISGTAYYSFNHFYDYYKRYKAIIDSKGETEKLQEIFGGEVPANFKWQDYTIIRIPVRMLPLGFMDDKHVAKAKATIHKAIFQMEYDAVFATDSNGFYKRSLVESCVVGKTTNPIEHPSCGQVNFHAVLKGNPTAKYVFGADPASEQDNFSVVVLEVWPDHRRIVYCWTTTRQRHKAKVAKHLTQEEDFYGYAARKIRDLMRVFPCERLVMDSQGGGRAVAEALHDRDKLRDGEVPIWEIINPDEGEEKDTDHKPGNHCLELVNFAKAEWTAAANHGLRKDFEDKAILFPFFDPLSIELALEEDKDAGRVKVDQHDASLERLYDTLDDAVVEIEQLKDELATIVHTQTGTSLRDRWDTPEVKGAGGKKGRMRKDRYSALVMANMSARTMQRNPVEPVRVFTGGWAKDLAGKPADSRMAYQGPDWFVSALPSTLGVLVNRGIQGGEE